MNFVLHLRGHLDFKGAYLLQSQLTYWAEGRAFPPGTCWIVDFIGVEQISLSGLFILAEFSRLAAKKQCKLRLCNLTLPHGMKLQNIKVKSKTWHRPPRLSQPNPQPLGVARRFSHLRQRLIAAQQLQGGEAAVSGYAFKERDRNAKAKS